jgi:hypothetical protein
VGKIRAQPDDAGAGRAWILPTSSLAGNSSAVGKSPGKSRRVAISGTAICLPYNPREWITS